MTAPDPGFLFWTHGRRDVEKLAMLAELREEAQHRRDWYPKAVEKCRMTELEMAHEINLIDALVEDFASEPGRPRPRNGFGWAQKVNALRREIMIRRHAYPKWVAKGRMTDLVARHKLTAIEAAHAWYWHHGLDFMDGADAAEIRRNIRAEIHRRANWALSQGYDDKATDAIWTGDWSGCPKTEEEAA